MNSSDTVPVFASVDSPSFLERYGAMAGRLRGGLMTAAGEGRPLGDIAAMALSGTEVPVKEVTVRDLRGDWRPFADETFFDRHNLFVMLTAKKAARRMATGPAWRRAEARRPPRSGQRVAPAPGATLTDAGWRKPLNSDGHPGGIAGRPWEYEAATMDWLHRTAEFLMLARDPLYAQLRYEQVDSQAGTAISLGGAGGLLVEPTRITVTGEVSRGPAIDGDLGDLEAEVSAIADQRLEQTMRAYFALVAEVTQRTGNAVDAHGDAAEGLLAMLEKMDIVFDDDGVPALQMVVSPADAERVREQLDGFTPDQQRRFAEIIARKREGYRASRRRRRLPRHCH